MRRSKAPTKQVVWTDRTSVTSKQAVLPAYTPPRSTNEAVEKNLEVGGLFFAAQTLKVNREVGYPLGVLEQGWQGDKDSIKAGSVMVYAGEVRVDERSKDGSTLRVVRHTFVVGVGRFIVKDMWLVKRPP